MKKGVACCLLLVVSFVGSAQTRNDSVYKTALSFLKDTLLRNKLDLMLLDSTSHISLNEALGKDLKDFMEDIDSNVISIQLRESFLATNKRSQKLSKVFPLSSEYKIFNFKERAAIFNDKDGWGSFYKKYPYYGFSSVSKIAYAKDNKTALLYVDFCCGGLCASEYILLLKRINNKWQAIFNKCVGES